MTRLSELGAALCAGIATVGTVICGWLGGWDVLLQALLALMVIDYITGVICAIVEKKLNSEVGFKGISKKVFILLLIGLAVLLDNAMGSEIVRSFTILFYISNEGISVLENATKLGVPFPDKLKEVLEQLKERK